MGIPFGYGQRMLLDAHMRYVRSAGGPVYLRVRNWQETPSPADGTSSDYLEVGVPISPTGAAGVDTGYIDILVDPPPNSEDVSLHNIGLNAGRLNFGSQIFTISHTFVMNQMRELNITDPYAVFRDRDGKKVIGLYHQSQLFSIESITHRDLADETVSWKLVCNRLENQSIDGQ